MIDRDLISRTSNGFIAIIQLLDDITAKIDTLEAVIDAMLDDKYHNTEKSAEI